MIIAVSQNYPAHKKLLCYEICAVCYNVFRETICRTGPRAPWCQPPFAIRIPWYIFSSDGLRQQKVAAAANWALRLKERRATQIWRKGALPKANQLILQGDTAPLDCSLGGRIYSWPATGRAGHRRTFSHRLMSE